MVVIEFRDDDGKLIYTAHGFNEDAAISIGENYLGQERAKKLAKFILTESDWILKKKGAKYISPDDADFLRSFNGKCDVNTEIGALKERLVEDPNIAIRYDQDKPHMDLLSPIAMFGIARVMTHGLKKYPGSQWKKGMAWSKVTASLLRHLFKFMAGEDLDPESGEPHVDHIAANAMFLQEYYRKHKNLDDRMKTGLE